MFCILSEKVVFEVVLSLLVIDQFHHLPTVLFGTIEARVGQGKCQYLVI